MTPSASPLPHSFHFTSLTLGPLLLFQHARHSLNSRSSPWPIPSPEIRFCLLFFQLTFTSQGDSQRGLCLATPPPPALTLIFEIFLARAIVCSFYLLCFATSVSISPVPMEDSEWQRTSGTWQKTKQRNPSVGGDYSFEGENR